MLLSSLKTGVALLWICLLLPCSVFALEPQKPAHYQIWGYYPYWLQDEWRTIDLGLFDQILFFEIPIGNGGVLAQANGWPERWEGLIESAGLKRVRLQPTFTIFDNGEFERIFSNEARRALLQVEMLELVDRTDSGGLQLDFELFTPVSKAGADGFRQFLRSVKHALTERAKDLTLFVLTEDGAGLYDKATLANADYVVIQGYDAHWKGSANAGAVALLHGDSVDSWDASLKYYLSLGVPRSKILMSVPYFGYEWPTVNGEPNAPTRGAGYEISFAPLPVDSVPDVRTSAMARIGQYGLRRDKATGSPYYAYQDETGWHQGWFEDEVSLSAKFEFIRQQRLAGVAVFSLGYDGGHFEKLLQRYFR